MVMGWDEFVEWNEKLRDLPPIEPGTLDLEIMRERVGQRTIEMLASLDEPITPALMSAARSVAFTMEFFNAIAPELSQELMLARRLLLGRFIALGESQGEITLKMPGLIAQALREAKAVSRKESTE
jgi:hypothetical protein